MFKKILVSMLVGAAMTAASGALAKDDSERSGGGAAQECVPVSDATVAEPPSRSASAANGASDSDSGAVAPETVRQSNPDHRT